MRVHILKTWPGFFGAVLANEKNFEVRRDDGRGFAVGDALALKEYDPDTERFLRRSIARIITYRLDLGPLMGIETDYCVLSLRCPTDAEYRAVKSEIGGEW